MQDIHEQTACGCDVFVQPAAPILVSSSPKFDEEQKPEQRGSEATLQRGELAFDFLT